VSVRFWSFAKATLLDRRSPACFWRRPLQASRLLAGAAANGLLSCSERVWPARRQECPICGWQGRRFRTFLSADEIIPRCICPVCRSFDRHRLLMLALQQELQRKPPVRPRVLLGFSLSTAMRLLLEREGLPRCYRSDFVKDDNRFAPDFLSDLRRMALGDGLIDWLFCSHVLEHIAELDLCLAEIARLLSPGGQAWIQVPIEPQLEHSHRLQVDPYLAHAHAWRFGRDFTRLLQRPDWEVSEYLASGMLDQQARERSGIHPQERYWVVRKA
jgi:hypothetical protein